MANATCAYNLGKVTCECLEEHTVFDVTTKSCIKLHPCDLPMDVYPCKNNGTCEIINGNDYSCTCNSASYGNHCQHTNLCYNNEELCYSAKCLMNETYHSYLCICNEDEYFNYKEKCCEKTACLGKICPLIRECQNGSCICKEGFREENEECKMTDEECEKRCERKNVNCVNASSLTEFTCTCKEGYYLNMSSLLCEASRCVFPFHPCEQKCNIDGDELCSCFDGFKLVDKHNCEVEQENSCDEEFCENGKCIKKDGKEVCVCDNGFMNYNGSQCIDICENNGHEMVQSICPNGCTHKNGDVKCICTGKYIQALDGISCTERDYCQKGDVGQMECKKVGKICIKHNKDPWYKCVCPKGLRDEDGENCTDSCSNEKIEECALIHQTCKYTSDSEKCHCPFSMTFDKKSNRCQFANDFYHVTIDVRIGQPNANIMYAMFDEENFKTSVSNSMKVLYGPSLLDTDVIECRSKEGIHTCTFSLIFEENADRIKIRLKDEHFCKTLLNSSEYCIFPPDLIVTKTSLETATFSSNKCDPRIKKKFCPNESNICNPLEPGYTCLCKPGFNTVSTFILGNDWRYKYHTCEDIDECKNSPCWKNSKCENTYGSFLCNCERGYVLNNTKDGCQGVCDDNPCGSNGKCKLFGDHKYECECNLGYKGLTCMEEDLYFKKYNFNITMVAAVLGSVLLLSISVIIALTIKLYREYHDVYNLEMNYNKNKYELRAWLPVKEGITTEQNGKLDNKKEKI